MDLAKMETATRINAVQDDKYSRDLQLVLLENGAPWIVPAEATAIVSYQKPDGTGGSYNLLPDGTAAWSASDNTVTVALAPQVCTVPGIVHLAVSLYCGESEITTFAVLLNVQRKPGLAADSENYHKVQGLLPAYGWEPNMYLGTDEEGNVVEKTAPEGSGSGSEDAVKPTVKTEDMTKPVGMDENGRLWTASEAPHNPMAGKSLSVLGDSISTYPGYIPEGYSCYYGTNLMNSVTYMWWHRLMTALEMNLCVNNAYSGSCVAVKAGVAEGYSGCNTLRNMRLHTETKIPDVIIVQMGTNDYIGKVPVGEYELADGPVFDTSTFMGAYAKMLWNISSKYPNTKVYCSTLPKMRNVRETEYPVSGMEVYNDAIRKVADLFGADIIDFASCGMTSGNIPNYMVDGRIHPNKDGQALMANKAIEKIAPYIATRYDVLEPVVNDGADTDDGDEGGTGGETPDVPEVTLTGISATYSGGDVAVGTAVSDLAGITVTAHYSDGTSKTVTGYTCSGTIAEGSNTVTVSYQGKTAVFTVTGVAESGGEPGGDSGGEGTQTYLARYSFAGGNSNDLAGSMNGTDTGISYTADGAVFGKQSKIAFGQYDLTQKTVELDVGNVTGSDGYVFVPNNFESSLYKGLKFADSKWTFMDAANGTNNSELTDVQAIANKTIKFVYGAKNGAYIPCSIYFGNDLVLTVEKAAYTGGYLFLGNGIGTLPMTIREMRIYQTA